jgi:hypothetical protein
MEQKGGEEREGTKQAKLFPLLPIFLFDRSRCLRARRVDLL